MSIKQNNSFSKNLDIPLLNETNDKNDYDYHRINHNERSIINLNKFQRNKTLQYFNTKNNKINKNFTSLTNKNNSSDNFKKRDNLLYNIKKKYKKKKKERKHNINN